MSEEAKTQPLVTPEGATLIPAGKGALVVGGGISPNAMGFRQVALGVCPRCETPAAPWQPPMSDHRYKKRVTQIREVQKLDNDAVAHAVFMKESGGFIETCSSCGISFWVPAAVAKIRISEEDSS